MNTKWYAVINNNVEPKTEVVAHSEQDARNKILDFFASKRNYDALAMWAKSAYEVTT